MRPDGLVRDFVAGRSGLLIPGASSRGQSQVTKRYDEPIDVTFDPVVVGAPVAFSWRGRRYHVDQRMSSWREAGEWWNGARARDREYYRVLARPAEAFATGDVDSHGFMAAAPGAVYDVYRDRRDGGWRLDRMWD